MYTLESRLRFRSWKWCRLPQAQAITGFRATGFGTGVATSGATAIMPFVHVPPRFGCPDIGPIMSEVGIGALATGDIEGGPAAGWGHRRICSKTYAKGRHNPALGFRGRALSVLARFGGRRTMSASADTPQQNCPRCGTPLQHGGHLAGQCFVRLLESEWKIQRCHYLEEKERQLRNSGRSEEADLAREQRQRLEQPKPVWRWWLTSWKNCSRAVLHQRFGRSISPQWLQAERQRRSAEKNAERAQQNESRSQDLLREASQVDFVGKSTKRLLQF